MKRMKKWLPVLLALILLLAACPAPAQEAEPTYESFNGKTLVMVALPVELTPEMVKSLSGLEVSEILLVPSLSEALAALRGGRADFLYTALTSAEFLCSADSSYGYVEGEQTTSFSMLTRAEDTKLTEQLSAAIDALNEKGIVDELMTEMTDQLLSRNLYTEDMFTALEGEETILVGVSGDMPPLDYISTEGNPAGFNVAYIYEIAREMGVKVEFVIVPTSTKFSALLSDRISTFLWNTSWVSNEEISASNAYYTTKSAIVYKK